MHYYIARVTSLSTGAVLWYPGEWFRKHHNPITNGRHGFNKRTMRKMARATARQLKMAGTLKVSIMRSTAARFVGSPAELAAPYHSGGVVSPDIYADVAASIFPANGPEEYLPIRELAEGCSLPKTTELPVYSKSEIFPVSVVRVTPQEDPAYKSVRFHVKDARGKTVKNCKTLKEAQETADRINHAQRVCDRLNAPTRAE